MVIPANTKMVMPQHMVVFCTYETGLPDPLSAALCGFVGLCIVCRSQVAYLTDEQDIK